MKNDMCDVLCRRSATSRRFGAMRTAILVGLALGASPAFAQTTGCTIGVDNQTVLVNTAFDTVARTAMPTSVTASPAIAASCGTSVLPASSIYRWTLTLKTLSFTMVQGTTSSTVLNAIGRQFSLAAAVLEVNDGPPGYTPTYQTSTLTTAVLSKLSSQLSVGQYRLSQGIDVQQTLCQWTGKKFSCQNDGGTRHFTANYTLTVVENPPPPPPPPATGQTTTTPPQPGHGVAPSPLTVRGAAAKFRCAI